MRLHLCLILWAGVILTISACQQSSTVPASQTAESDTPAIPPSVPVADKEQTPEGTAPSAIVSREWLIGAWVAEGDMCAGDVSAIFRPDESYGSGQLSGVWRLQGDQLFLTTREMSMDDDTLGPEKTGNYKIIYISLNELRWDDARFRRCREGRGPAVEPWHPTLSYDRG